MVNGILLIILGLVAGILSGLIGIGGGTIIVPALILFFGFSQHMALGTTLALLIPPVGILAVWIYYRDGYVDFHTASLICIGFLFGAFLGARIATNLSNVLLERIFGVVLLLIALKMIFAR